MSALTIDYARYPNGVTGTVQAGGSIPDGTYYYRVSAVNSEGQETFAGPESDPVTVGSGNNTVSLTWNEVPGCTYKVYRRPSTEEWGDGNDHYLGTASTESYTDSAASESSGDVMSYTSDQVTAIPEDHRGNLVVYSIPNSLLGSAQYQGTAPKELRLSILESGDATTVRQNLTKLQNARAVGLPVQVYLYLFGSAWMQRDCFIRNLTWSLEPGTRDDQGVWMRITLELVEA